ncbi:hypothetical protein Acr_14g0008640 [Actinidia rufa]|uniref:Uncharacterized protein n=1 Tax=Actinidia rufa TaxID=165716 RepID=A0A7J0FR88_9ERIC|nr:hypothetical protein Acr_14g0008640 [Actinidia rufa]
MNGIIILLISAKQSAMYRSLSPIRQSEAMHRGANDHDALLDKLPSLPPLHMLLDTVEGTTRRSVQVLPPGLVLDCAWSRDTAVPKHSERRSAPKYEWCRGAGVWRILWCPLALEPIPTTS